MQLVIFFTEAGQHSSYERHNLLPYIQAQYFQGLILTKYLYSYLWRTYLQRYCTNIVYIFNSKLIQTIIQTTDKVHFP